MEIELENNASKMSSTIADVKFSMHFKGGALSFDELNVLFLSCMYAMMAKDL